MKLSTEIRLGSLLVQEPQGNDVRSCAVGMANLSAGYTAVSKGDIKAYTEILARHPWLIGMRKNCPFCTKSLYEEEVVWHLFDDHVAVAEWHRKNYQFITIEQLVDFIASIEPRDEPCTKNEQTEASLATDLAQTVA